MHTIVAVENGKQVLSWGSNTAGQLGFTHAELALLEAREPSLTSEAAAAAAAVAKVKRRSSVSSAKVFKEPSRRLLGLPAKVLEGGEGGQEQKGSGTKQFSQEKNRTAIPRVVQGLHDVEQLVCGSHHSACLSCIGHGESSGREWWRSKLPLCHLATPSVDSELTPTRLDPLTGDRILRVYTWGCGDNGRLGHGNEKYARNPKMVSALRTRNVIDIDCGGAHMAAVTREGSLLT